MDHRVKIGIVRPASAHGRSGNRMTALRCARFLRELGYGVRLGPAWDGRDVDALVALHAGKSRDSIEAFARRHPDRPLIVIGTGTDLYDDAGLVPAVRTALELASRIVVLQEQAVELLPPHLQDRARVVEQSSEAAPSADDVPGRVTVLAHLRAVKDPLLPARAVRDLPAASRIHVELWGGALEDELERAARDEERTNERFRWRGDRPHAEVLAELGRTWVLVVPSRHEGGSNALCEALAAGRAVLATDIPGNRGLLGDDHPGLFPVGDAQALRTLLLRAEDEPGFHAELVRRSRERAELVSPAREREAWRSLLGEVLPDPASETTEVPG